MTSFGLAQNYNKKRNYNKKLLLFKSCVVLLSSCFLLSNQFRAVVSSPLCAPEGGFVLHVLFISLVSLSSSPVARLHNCRAIFIIVFSNIRFLFVFRIVLWFDFARRFWHLSRRGVEASNGIVSSVWRLSRRGV